MKIIVTGGAGFIGGAIIRQLITDKSNDVLCLDSLTYASDLQSLDSFLMVDNFSFVKTDLRNLEDLQKAIFNFNPDAIIHAAAESHVDRSIDDPENFIFSNVVGTYNLLVCVRKYLVQDGNIDKFKFLHISTDEVFGSIEEGLFTESSSYRPNSPYSASKAASDHLVRAWGKTYGIKTLITHCSNNFGPFQFPEKLIPHFIISALSKKTLPLYGTGENIRDWIYVEDHASAVLRVLDQGVTGQSYNIGGSNEYSNKQIAYMICDHLEGYIKINNKSSFKYRDLIEHVEDRPGHDMRYAIDSSKLIKELSWTPQYSFSEAFEKTITWYLENDDWWKSILNNNYSLDRLGIK